MVGRQRGEQENRQACSDPVAQGVKGGSAKKNNMRLSFEFTKRGLGRDLPQ